MPRNRILTDEQCKDLAAWFRSVRTVREKAKELGISPDAVYDSIARAEGNDPRETPQSEVASG